MITLDGHLPRYFELIIPVAVVSEQFDAVVCLDLTILNYLTHDGRVLVAQLQLFLVLDYLYTRLIGLYLRLEVMSYELFDAL